MHYYQFNIGDYASDTQHLDEMEDLAYRRMLDLYYQKESPLPEDVSQIARYIRMRSHVECIESVLQEFFELKADGYHNHGADKVLNKTYAKSESARKAAEARWNKIKGSMQTQCKRNADASKIDANALNNDADALDSHAVRNATQYPIPNTQDNNKDLCEVETSPGSTLEQMSSSANKVSNTVLDIFNYWVQVMGKNKTTTQLTTKRKKNISARLKDGYTVEQIKQAVNGCRDDPFSMGANDRNKPFNDIELICRTGEKLESFLEVSGNGTNKQNDAYAGMSSAQRQFEEAKRARDSKQSGLSMATNDRDVLGQMGQEEWSGRTFDMD